MQDVKSPQLMVRGHKSKPVRALTERQLSVLAALKRVLKSKPESEGCTRFEISTDLGFRTPRTGKKRLSASIVEMLLQSLERHGLVSKTENAEGQTYWYQGHPQTSDKQC